MVNVVIYPKIYSREATVSLCNNLIIIDAAFSNSCSILGDGILVVFKRNVAAQFIADLLTWDQYRYVIT